MNQPHKSYFKSKIGAPPGSLVHIGKHRDESVKVSQLDFNETVLDEKSVDELADLAAAKENQTVSWVNVDGIHNASIIKNIGELFEIDALVLEDIMNTGHRPKVEEHENFTFIIIKMLHYNEQEEHIESEQVSIVLGKTFVISFQEKEGDVFDPIRDRIRKALGRVRQKGTDYLAYTLIDIIIDNYFNIIEILGDELEELEVQVLEKPNDALLNDLQWLKKELVKVRKAIYPLREMTRFLSTGGSLFLEKETLKYYRDAYDHSISVIDSIESYVEVTNSIRDLYMSNMSNKMNKIMKVLTIMASLFIPLTFIVGVYGMNFEYMPELAMRYGYFVVWGIMIVITGGMIYYFKKKDWF
ncbi:MAG: magnesium/cobalt transporter CorA [Crocinitomicaceae bacterium]